jgi:hypothetical protein
MAPPEGFCEEHIKTATMLATMVERVNALIHSFDEFKDRIAEHIEEGEKTGGVRDRVTALELEVAALKKVIWKTAIVSGLIGGFISQLTPEAFLFIVGLLK